MTSREDRLEELDDVSDKPRTLRVTVPEIPGVPPDDVIKTLATVWRQNTDAETPTLHQLLARRATRIDVDAVAGYLAVVTAGETHRAIGIRRELVAPLVAVLTGQPVADVRKALAKGPAKFTPLEPDTRG